MFTERDQGRRTSTRKRQPWPAGKSFKILSLDGGGIRGIFPAAIVKEIATQLGQDDGIADYFDLIAGTSTGGIVGIALGLRIDPERIFDLYTKRGREIFPPFWTQNRLLRFSRQLFTSLYDHEALERILRTEFGSKRFGDSTTRLLVPAFVGPRAQVSVFKTDHHADYKSDWRTPAWEIARATSAAPTYFEGHRFNESYFLDGGVWANNPIMLAVVEAMQAYDIQLEQIRVLSVGTGNVPPVLKQRAARAGFLGWRSIISTAMYLTTDTALSQARLLLGFDAIVRLQPSGVAATIELDDWQRAKELLPTEAAARFAEASEAVMGFFDEKSSEREKHYS